MPSKSKAQLRVLLAKKTGLIKKWAKKYGFPKSLNELVSRARKGKK